MTPEAQPLAIWTTHRPRPLPVAATWGERSWRVTSILVALLFLVVVAVFLAPSIVLPGFGTEWIRGAILGGAALASVPLLSTWAHGTAARRHLKLPPTVTTTWRIYDDRLVADDPMRQWHPLGLAGPPAGLARGVLRSLPWRDVVDWGLETDQSASGGPAVRLYARQQGSRIIVVADLPDAPSEAARIVEAIRTLAELEPLTDSEREKWTQLLDPRLGVGRTAFACIIGLGALLVAGFLSLQTSFTHPISAAIFGAGVVTAGLAVALFPKRHRVGLTNWTADLAMFGVAILGIAIPAVLVLGMVRVFLQAL